VGAKYKQILIRIYAQINSTQLMFFKTLFHAFICKAISNFVSCCGLEQCSKTCALWIYIFNRPMINGGGKGSYRPLFLLLFQNRLKTNGTHDFSWIWPGYRFWLQISVIRLSTSSTENPIWRFQNRKYSTNSQMSTCAEYIFSAISPKNEIPVATSMFEIQQQRNVYFWFGGRHLEITTSSYEEQ